MIDLFVPFIYLLIILIYGMSCSKNIHSAKDFSLSHRRYPVWILFATLSASFIGGGFSFGNATQVYLYGIGNIIALWGFSIKEILIGHYLAPNIQRFAHVTSPGGIIEKVYGQGPQIITGLFSVIFCCGILGAQIGAIGAVFHVFFNIPESFGMIIGMTIIILYSSFGGMEAVVATDVVQFFVLAIGLPLTLFFAIKEIGGWHTLIALTPPTHLNVLNHHSVFSFINLFFTLMLGECLIPPCLQRLLMGKSPKTASTASILGGLFSIPFFAVTGFIGLCAIILFPTIDATLALPVIIEQTVPTGLRGFITAAIISVVMSSADSVLNSASIGFSQDILVPFCHQFHWHFSDKMQLLLMRILTLLTGLGALLFALNIPNIFDLLLLSYSFWTPIILVPLVVALLGGTSNPKVFYLCVATGVIFTFNFNFILSQNLSAGGTLVGVLANLFVIYIYRDEITFCPI